MARGRRGLRAATAAAAVPAEVRAAIYTRKSTSSGLDGDFTSLHNQRERAEAFVTSQGWVLVPTPYDDGGYSGGNVDRPALQQMLADAGNGLLDAVVVYRLDRLSRSIVDFGRVHEFLDQHGVALVSVTESINTTSPHGRMMVNVLLSFAQYERELIAERTSDKMQAARRRGRWTGGMPPLGYDVAPEGGRLTVNKTEAEMVKAIFELYAETPSLVKVADELNRRGWRRKSWTTKTGKRREGGKWDRVVLSRMLKDPLYVGEQKLGDETFPGEHKGIVKKKLFHHVQALLDDNRATNGASARNRHGFLLRGLLRCSACDAAMVPHPTRNHGRLYRYYTCRAAQKRGHGSCPTKCINADRVEAFVVNEIKRVGADPALQEQTFRQAVAQVKAQRRGLKMERKRLIDDLSRARTEAERLVGTVGRVDGSVAEAVADELAKAQVRVRELESRQAEIATELASLDAQAIDREELTRALAAFEPIWDVLLTPERERVFGLLIERIDYRGDTQELTIRWRLDGFRQLDAEVGR